MRHPFDGCPLCGATDLAHVGTFGCSHHPRWAAPLPVEIVWRGCQSCGHVFTDGYFTDAGLGVLFSGTNPEQEPGVDAERNRDRWAPTVARVAGLVPSGRWLDVGFGDGSAMFVADEWGYQTVGIDLRASSVAAMQRFGFDARCVPLGDVHGETFDVVSLFDVLEHMPFPKAELAHAARLLNPGGVLVVSCPNMGCFAWSDLDARGVNPYWFEIEHYHNFTRARLVGLLVECGFEVVSFDISRRWRLGMEITARLAARGV